MVPPPTVQYVTQHRRPTQREMYIDDFRKWYIRRATQPVKGFMYKNPPPTTHEVTRAINQFQRVWVSSFFRRNKREGRGIAY